MGKRSTKPVKGVVRRLRKGGVGKKKAVGIGKQFARQRAKVQKRAKR